MQYKYGLKMHSNAGYSQKYPYQLNETTHDQIQQQFNQQMSVYQNQPNASQYQTPQNNQIPNQQYPQQPPGVHYPQPTQMVQHPQLQNMNSNVPLQLQQVPQGNNIPQQQILQQPAQIKNQENSHSNQKVM